MDSLFQDRPHAGKLLADKLAPWSSQPDLLILALPRGGVPVAFEIAAALHAPLDVFLVRKLGVPGQEELAMGALASGGVRVLNQSIVDNLAIPPEVIDAVAQREEMELRRREQLYRNGRPAPVIAGRSIILVDDGLATGASMRAAVRALRGRMAERIIVAVPVAAPATCREFRDLADEVVCALTPADFHSVGEWYRDFSQTTDEEVRDLLDKAQRQTPAEAQPPAHHQPTR